MKQLYSFIIVASVFNSVNGFTTVAPYKKQVNNNPKVEVVFTNGLKYNDLVKIKQDLIEKGISIEYSKLEFDKKMQLKKIEFFVDCHDGFSGGASTSHLSADKKFGFYRDYEEHSKEHFFAGYFK